MPGSIGKLLKFAKGTKAIRGGFVQQTGRVVNGAEAKPTTKTPNRRSIQSVSTRERKNIYQGDCLEGENTPLGAAIKPESQIKMLQFNGESDAVGTQAIVRAFRSLLRVRYLIVSFSDSCPSVSTE